MNKENLLKKKQELLNKCTMLNTRINQNKVEVESMKTELLITTGYINRLDEEIKEIEDNEVEKDTDKK